MSKSKYLTELVGYIAELNFHRLKRHFIIAVKKRADSLGLFEDWHPIPRIIFGYICGFFSVLVCFTIILPSAAVWSILGEKIKGDKVTLILASSTIAGIVILIWCYLRFRNIQFFEASFRF